MGGGCKNIMHVWWSAEKIRRPHSVISGIALIENIILQGYTRPILIMFCLLSLSIIFILIKLFIFILLTQTY